MITEILPSWLALLCWAILGTCLPQAFAETNREEIALWPGAPPGMHEVEDVELRDERGDGKIQNGLVTGISRPTLTVYRPSAGKSNGTAVVICPGGGYGGLAIDKEGHDFGRWFLDRGVVVGVLKYRTAPLATHPFPLSDAQRALRILHSRASEWQIQPERIGIAGFSAGGHLASTAGTRFDEGDSDAADPIDRASCRASFMVLIYPVISMRQSVTHLGSRKNLLGENPEPELIDELSNDLQVNANVGPTFLVHASDDKAVPVENSLLFYQSLRQQSVPAEMHIYATGGHGFGMYRGNRPADRWPELLEGWLRGRGLIK